MFILKGYIKGKSGPGPHFDEHNQLSLKRRLVFVIIITLLKK